VHNLRCSFSCCHRTLEAFDAQVRSCLSVIINSSLYDSQWMQASLPVRDGGFGIRRCSQIAPSAFLASAISCSDLFLAILPHHLANVLDPLIEQARQAWELVSGVHHSSVTSHGSQLAWDTPVIWETQARLLAVKASHAGEWLNSSPFSAVGLRMNDDVIQVAAGLRLDANLCAPHTCLCGTAVDARGIHGLSSSTPHSDQRHRMHSTWAGQCPSSEGTVGFIS
jgi:hypothetical protein